MNLLDDVVEDEHLLVKLVNMNGDRVSPPIGVIPYNRIHWRPLWELRFHQLAEHGIILSPEEIPDQPLDVSLDDPEWDYHHISEIYLSGAGGFWLSWWENDPAGHIGGQDLGGVIELRRMYVRSAYRQRGVGTCLVQALLDHCKTQSVKAVELWTAGDGLGRKLYERMGFTITSGPRREYSDRLYRTNYIPGEDEIRMRLDLT